MVRLALHSIAYEAKTLNLAKEGFTAYYVDGTDGLDTHDGGSWAQAFKTIQHAVDEADSWCKIFIKAGTYAENVTIAKQAIHIIGEKEDTVIISPASGDAVTISSNECVVSGCKLLVSENNKKGVYVTGDYNIIKDCIVGAGAAITNMDGCFLYGDNNVADGITGIFYTGTSGTAIMLYGAYNEAKNCFVDDTNSWEFGIECGGGDYNSVHDNTVRGCTIEGINVYFGVSVATVFHNNLIGNTTQMSNAGTVFAFENFFDDHTTDTDNDGLCDTAYALSGAVGGYDYQPVSHFDGWKRESLGDVAGSDRVMGKTQVKTISVTAAANAAADTTLGTVTTQGCIVRGIVIHADAAQTADLTSCPVHGGAAKVLTFISAADAIQANLNAENKQVGWDGEVYLPTGSTIVMVHNGTGATALNQTVTIRYVATVNGGHLA